MIPSNIYIYVHAFIILKGKRNAVSGCCLLTNTAKIILFKKNKQTWLILVVVNVHIIWLHYYKSLSHESGWPGKKQSVNYGLMLIKLFWNLGLYKLT